MTERLTIPLVQFKEVFAGYLESKRRLYTQASGRTHRLTVGRFLRWVEANQPDNRLDSAEAAHKAAEGYFARAAHSEKAHSHIRLFIHHVCGITVLDFRQCPPHRYRAVYEEFISTSQLPPDSDGAKAARRFLWWVLATNCADTALTAAGWPEAKKAYLRSLTKNVKPGREKGRLGAFGGYLGSE